METKFSKAGYLGIAFHEWLEWLEQVECAVYKGRTMTNRYKPSLARNLFDIPDPDSMLLELMPLEATIARCVRSSVKYRMTLETSVELMVNYQDEVDWISDNVPVHLPHQYNTFIFEALEGLTIMASVIETKTRDGSDYEELGVTADESWICISPVAFAENRLILLPVEIHMTLGRVWSDSVVLKTAPQGVTPKEAGSNLIDSFMKQVYVWIHSFSLAGVLRKHSVGVKPERFDSKQPRKPRRKSQHPKFEHVVIELPMNHVDESCGGKHVFQPKKRLHQVRGFYRHYKSGKVVWVKPHWRGDKKLGVIRKDYEMILENAA